ncbi:hypothetical protein HD554DRAFT_1846235 [Boletus coccyginus]|nr:hypothetical protein HD554DRAFT_1846235 [Boletus coccyginus]
MSAGSLHPRDGKSRRVLVDEPQSLKLVINAYLVSGTPPSALSSHTILAALEPEDADGHVRADEMLFGQLGVLRSVALKVKESMTNERPAISVHEVLKEMAANLRRFSQTTPCDQKVYL